MTLRLEATFQNNEVLVSNAECVHCVLEVRVHLQRAFLPIHCTDMFVMFVSKTYIAMPLQFLKESAR